MFLYSEQRSCPFTGDVIESVGIFRSSKKYLQYIGFSDFFDKKRGPVPFLNLYCSFLEPINSKKSLLWI
jgi:hypothetical protein